MEIWYSPLNLVYFFRFGILYQEKSGNPEGQLKKIRPLFNVLLLA
jgi:hypothetical protein